MTGSDPKADLQRYPQAGRDAVVWKLDGLSEYDIRRPLVPTGTNLLGVVKHLADILALYRRAWAHTDATVEALPLDALGSVAWRPRDHKTVTLHRTWSM